MSSVSESRAWVNAPMSRRHPRARMVARISSRRRRPGADAVGRVQQWCEVDGAVEGEPAHQLRVQEVLAVAADFPDAVVGFLPARGGGVGGPDQELTFRGFEPVELFGERPGGVQELAEHVELELAPGCVADADGPAVPPAREVGELALGEVVLAADAEHDLEVVGQRGGGRAGEPGEEAASFVRTGRDPEGLEGQAGVAYPCVAVVPVAHTSNRLGKRRGGCGDDRAGRLEGERLERHAASVDELTVGALVALVCGAPGSPCLDGRGQEVGDLVLIPQRRSRFPSRSVVHCEVDGVAGAGDEAGRGAPRVQLEWYGRRQRQDVAAAASHDPARRGHEEWTDDAVFGAGLEVEVECDLTGLAGDASDQRPGCEHAEVVTARVRSGAERIRQRDASAGGLEGRLEGHALLEVATRDLRFSQRADCPVSGMVIE